MAAWGGIFSRKRRVGGSGRLGAESQSGSLAGQAGENEGRWSCKTGIESALKNLRQGPKTQGGRRPFMTWPAMQSIDTADGRILDNHTIAVQTSAQKLVGGTPEVQAKAAILEVTEPLDDEVLISLEIQRPLVEGQVVAVTIIEDLENLKRRLCQLIQEVVQHQEGVISAVNVFHHVG
jgi:hypothetical protein